MMKCNIFYCFVLTIIASIDGISTNFNQAEISEEERRAADTSDRTRVLSSFNNVLPQENGRKFGIATSYNKEGQILKPRIAAFYKKKELEAKESDYDAQRVNYHGDYNSYYSGTGSRIGFPGMFSSGMQYQDRGVLYGNSGYSHSGPSSFGSYGHSDGGYYYPSQYESSSGFDHGFIKKLGLKGLLLPIAGIALLGAAAALTANPVLLQLGTLNGRRRRRSIQPPIFNSNIYPINPYIRPNKK
ncbi:hypothetical protein RN001_002501 [Aquatica leii]|uniref:Uncharacterized protein n=1 Tax=Aquatica leii TaxID=1421715 RepID=A0AAN7SSU8_9COLE|nr:hypothetical protein RN001_002501 [Aquatica leii]